MLDRKGFQREAPSVVIVNALVSACAHLAATVEFAPMKSANRITLWSMLRPALMSATTAGWVLLATDDVARLHRAGAAVNESMRYELRYGENVAMIPGGQAEERQAWMTARYDELHQWAAGANVPLKKRDSVPMTDAVREVAAKVTGDEYRMSAYWNYMSSGAHGLGWHIQTRTFGAGTQDLTGSDFVAFPIALDRAEYVGVLTDITYYVGCVLRLARAFASDPRDLAARGDLVAEEDGSYSLRVVV